MGFAHFIHRTQNLRMHMILWTLGAAGMRPTGPKPDEHGVISFIRTSSIKPVGLDAFPP